MTLVLKCLASVSPRWNPNRGVTHLWIYIYVYISLAAQPIRPICHHIECVWVCEFSPVHLFSPESVLVLLWHIVSCLEFGGSWRANISPSSRARLCEIKSRKKYISFWFSICLSLLINRLLIHQRFCLSLRRLEYEFISRTRIALKPNHLCVCLVMMRFLWC